MGIIIQSLKNIDAKNIKEQYTREFGFSINHFVDEFIKVNKNKCYCQLFLYCLQTTVETEGEDCKIEAGQEKKYLAEVRASLGDALLELDVSIREKKRAASPHFLGIIQASSLLIQRVFNLKIEEPDSSFFRKDVIHYVRNYILKNVTHELKEKIASSRGQPGYGSSIIASPKYPELFHLNGLDRAMVNLHSHYPKDQADYDEKAKIAEQQRQAELKRLAAEAIELAKAQEIEQARLKEVQAKEDARAQKLAKQIMISLEAAIFKIDQYNKGVDSIKKKLDRLFISDILSFDQCKVPGVYAEIEAFNTQLKLASEVYIVRNIEKEINDFYKELTSKLAENKNKLASGVIAVVDKYKNANFDRLDADLAFSASRGARLVKLKADIVSLHAEKNNLHSEYNAQWNDIRLVFGKISKEVRSHAPSAVSFLQLKDNLANNGKVSKSMWGKLTENMLVDDSSEFLAWKSKKTLLEFFFSERYNQRLDKFNILKNIYTVNKKISTAMVGVRDAYDELWKNFKGSSKSGELLVSFWRFKDALSNIRSVLGRSQVVVETLKIKSKLYPLNKDKVVNKSRAEICRLMKSIDGMFGCVFKKNGENIFDDYAKSIDEVQKIYKAIEDGEHRFDDIQLEQDISIDEVEKNKQAISKKANNVRTVLLNEIKVLDVFENTVAKTNHQIAVPGLFFEKKDDVDSDNDSPNLTPIGSFRSNSDEVKVSLTSSEINMLESEDDNSEMREDNDVENDESKVFYCLGEDVSGPCALRV